MTNNFRRIREGDFEKVAALQDQNLFSVLSEADRQNGFLSTKFTPQNFREMNDSIGIAVALDGEKICGYLCASTLNHNLQFPFPAAAIAHAMEISYQGKNLKNYNCFMANPLCIDKDYRGIGVINGLCDEVIKFAAKNYDLALSFIADANQRSLQASKKVGMEALEKFSLNGNEFWIVVRKISQ